MFGLLPSFIFTGQDLVTLNKNRYLNIVPADARDVILLFFNSCFIFTGQNIVTLNLYTIL